MGFIKMFPSFINYTEEMYNGNEPACKSDSFENGDVWSTQYGKAITDKQGKLIACSFTIRPYTSIYICADSLKIYKISTLAGKTQIFSNEDLYSPYAHIDMSEDKAEAIINKSLPNCKIWTIIQKRAKDLFDSYIQNKYAFLYKGA